MSNTKWTPGPWFVGVPNVAEWSRIGVHSDEYVICDLCSDVPFPQKANAHLIASAPDLYEALRYAATHIEMELGNDHDAAVNARKQLAKARGEEQSDGQ